MPQFSWEDQIQAFDDRRDILIPGNREETIEFCTRQWIEIGQSSINQRGRFIAALSGGSTPNAIFKQLSLSSHANQLDWSNVFLFWSDERNIPPDHCESNYHLAMESGIASLPIPKDQIFRMQAEENIEDNARLYEEKLSRVLPSKSFDLMMLGMGEDGHTASLFPHTHGLHADHRLIIANYVPQKLTWRMSVTYDCIHSSRLICIYVLGKNKAEAVKTAFIHPYDPDLLPVQRVGTPTHKALWILDRDAAENLINETLTE